MPTSAAPLYHPGERVQIVEVSTLYGLACLSAGIAAGCFDVPDAPARRILLTSNNAQVPEAAQDLRDNPEFARLAAGFDAVFSLNETLAPLHPGHWRPTPEEAPVWERAFRALWGLGAAPVELLMESIQVPPAWSLGWVFAQAPITVYADGLMSYGPTRIKLDAEVGTRIDRVVTLPLAAGIEPLLLQEFGVTQDELPLAPARDALAQVGSDVELGVPDDRPVTVLLGQYLSPLGLISAEQEARLHADMAAHAAASGARTLVFKPHPTAPSDLTGPLRARAAELGVELHVCTAPVLAETLFARLPVERVVGCFSTGLMTATTLFDIPAARVGTADLLTRLRPLANSNRIPLLLVDRLLTGPDHPTATTTARTAELLVALGYVMQPEVLVHLRPRAETILAGPLTDAERAWFPTARLAELGLPGGRHTLRTRALPVARRVARRVYATERRLEQRLGGSIRGQ